MPELTQESAYEATIRWLYERINYEKTGHAPYSDTHYRLDRMRRLLAELDDPHLAAPVIHIAGTKGKGSTASLISHMLASAGLRTGLYTSPHLLRLEERFQFNNTPCSGQQLIELVETTHAAADRLEAAGGGKATFFELTTAVAMLYFAKQNAQAVVLEVGLGGRLDSTNVCQPALCVITTIGLDHQAQLGNTITAIAGEKAGIIKPGVPVVSSARHPDAQRVIVQVAQEKKSPLRLIERDFTGTWAPLVLSRRALAPVPNQDLPAGHEQPEASPKALAPVPNQDLPAGHEQPEASPEALAPVPNQNLPAGHEQPEASPEALAPVPNQNLPAGHEQPKASPKALAPVPTANLPAVQAQVEFEPRYAPSRLGRSHWQLSMLGQHNLDNLSAALASVDWLLEKGWNIPTNALPAAVQNTCVTARLQIVGHAPTRLIDTAHNADSIAATLAALETHFPGRAKCLVLATSRDKDIEAILKWAMPACQRVILTQYHNNPRGLPLVELVEQAHAVARTLKQPPILEKAPTPALAWKRAMEVTSIEDVLCATGSFFLAAELLEIV